MSFSVAGQKRVVGRGGERRERNEWRKWGAKSRERRETRLGIEGKRGKGVHYFARHDVSVSELQREKERDVNSPQDMHLSAILLGFAFCCIMLLVTEEDVGCRVGNEEEKKERENRDSHLSLRAE